MNKEKPVIIADPYPQTLERIFDAKTWERLSSMATIISSTDEHMSEEEFDSYLPQAIAIIGQTPMPKERLDKAVNLRVIFNVEGNFYQNIDYKECFKRSIRVLNCGKVYARPVAEMALAMALDLTRGITWEHMRFTQGTERYVLDGNKNSRLLTNAKVGIIGFGLLGRSLRPLLAPFNCPVKVYDPWLPSSVIEENNCTSTTLDDVLSTSDFIFILAGVTNENQGFLGKTEFDKIQDNANVILVSRAAVVDFEEFTRQLATGRFKAATDVFPSEPFDAHHPIRTLDNVILSPHRAGGIPQAFYEIGEMVTDDFNSIVRNLSPVRMQAAQPEIVSRLVSKPVKD
jgi:phosphoglycerate dehydrogenase-like enzyme